MDSVEDGSTKLAASSVSTKSLSRFEKKNFKNLQPQIIAATIAMSNHIVVGIGLAYSAILIPQLGEKTSGIPVTKEETSWVASVTSLVAPIGSILSGYVMDKWGRINVLKVSMIPGVIGWILIATAQNLNMIIIGRVVSGFSASIATGPAIVYLTEIARKDMRGWLMNWRIIAWLVNIYLIVPFILQFLIPESPVWLISKGRKDEAANSLNWFHKYQPQPKDQAKTFAQMQLDLLIKEDEVKKSEAKSDGCELFKEFLKPTGYKPLLIISGVFFFQQYSGIYIFLCYSVTFFEAVGTSVDPYLASIFIGVIRLLMSILNTWMLKRYTRRLLFIISSLGMGVCMFISGLFTFWIKNGTTTLSWVPVIFLLFYVVASMVGLLTIPWTMTAELFPLKIRSMAHSISTSTVNIIMFLAVQYYVNMEVFFGGSAGIQWFFSAMSFGAAVFIFVVLPETHKKKLSEIEEYFKHNTIYLRRKKKGQTRNKNTKASSGDSERKDSDKLLDKI